MQRIHRNKWSESRHETTAHPPIFVVARKVVNSFSFSLAIPLAFSHVSLSLSLSVSVSWFMCDSVFCSEKCGYKINKIKNSAQISQIRIVIGITWNSLFLQTFFNCECVRGRDPDQLFGGAIQTGVCEQPSCDEFVYYLLAFVGFNIFTSMTRVAGLIVQLRYKKQHASPFQTRPELWSLDLWNLSTFCCVPACSGISIETWLKKPFFFSVRFGFFSLYAD